LLLVDEVVFGLVVVRGFDFDAIDVVFELFNFGVFNFDGRFEFNDFPLVFVIEFLFGALCVLLQVEEFLLHVLLGCFELHYFGCEGIFLGVHLLRFGVCVFQFVFVYFVFAF
jgi:hypothetical protein